MKPIVNSEMPKATTFLIFMILVTAGKVECNTKRNSPPGCDVILRQPKKYIQSPNYPRPSYPRTKCSWTILNPKNHHVALRPNKLIVGAKEKDDDTHGFLELYDGCFGYMFLVENISSLETSKHIESAYSNQVNKYLWVSTDNCLTIRFDSGKGNGNRFLFDYEETTDICGGTVLGSNGSITVPQSLHSNYKECVWIISVPKGPNIELTFEEFDVTSSIKGKSDCSLDFVKIQLGRSSSSAEENRFCGKSRPYPVYIKRQDLRITLSSVGELAKKKLKAYYQSVDVSTSSSSKACGGKMKSPVGTFFSPNFGDQYPKDLHCVWQIEVPAGYKVKLKFSFFEVEPGQWDCVRVYDGLASWSLPIKEFCGLSHGTLPPAVFSTSNKMRVVFTTNKKYGGRGFRATYSPFDPNASPEEDSPGHFTGIMIGTTCGIIFIVLTVLAVAHTRKVRHRRAHMRRRTDVASTVSFDVHQLNAPPSYETVMSAPDRYPNTPRQSQRSFSSRPQDPIDHREISHLLGSEDEDDEPPPPPYPGIVGQPCLTPSLLESRSTTSIPPGYPAYERDNTGSKHELEDDNCHEDPWQIRSEMDSCLSESALLLSQGNSENHLNTPSGNPLDTGHRKENQRIAPMPQLERQDTGSSFVTDV